MKKIAFLCLFLSFAALSVYAEPVTDDEATNNAIELVKNGKYDEAIAEFDKLVKMDPNNPQVYNNRGIAYLARVMSGQGGKKDLGKLVSDFSNANLDFTKAIALDPKFAAAYYNRGLTNLTKYKEAIADFTKTIELSGDHAKAYYYRSVAYYNLKSYDRSRSDVEKAQSLGYKVDPVFLKKLSGAPHAAANEASKI